MQNFSRSDLMQAAQVVPMGEKSPFLSAFYRFKLVTCILLGWQLPDEAKIAIVKGQHSPLNLVIGHGVFSNWWYTVHRERN